MAPPGPSSNQKLLKLAALVAAGVVLLIAGLMCFLFFLSRKRAAAAGHKQRRTSGNKFHDSKRKSFRLQESGLTDDLEDDDDQLKRVSAVVKVSIAVDGNGGREVGDFAYLEACLVSDLKDDGTTFSQFSLNSSLEKSNDSDDHKESRSKSWQLVPHEPVYGTENLKRDSASATVESPPQCILLESPPDQPQQSPAVDLLPPPPHPPPPPPPPPPMPLQKKAASRVRRSSSSDILAAFDVVAEEEALPARASFPSSLVFS